MAVCIPSAFPPESSSVDDSSDCRRPRTPGQIQLSLEEIKAIREFFLLLDKWDRQKRWQQVWWQCILQLRHRLGLKVDNEIFNQILVNCKCFEEHMTALALKKGKWLHDMLMERLGLTEWRVIAGGQAEIDPA